MPENGGADFLMTPENGGADFFMTPAPLQPHSTPGLLRR